jgi:hypothetical protein
MPIALPRAGQRNFGEPVLRLVRFFPGCQETRPQGQAQQQGEKPGLGQ